MGEETIAEWARAHLPSGIDGIPLVSDQLFYAYVGHTKSSASLITPHSEWETKLDHYLADESTSSYDKEHIQAGKHRGPSYFEGGGVLDLQPQAGAITLDDCVFVRPGQWNAKTYVHEMVHVGQYGSMGPSLFLATYFGVAASVIVANFVTHTPIDVMHASSLETDAYDIGNRFDAYTYHPS